MTDDTTTTTSTDEQQVRNHLAYMYGYLTAGHGDPYEPDGHRVRDTMTMPTVELADRVKRLVAERRDR